MKRLLVVGLLLVAVGCSSGGGGGGGQPPCGTGMALPDGWPQTGDGFYTLLYSTCYFEPAEIDQLRVDMHNATNEIMACLDTVYDYDFPASHQGTLPEAEMIRVVPKMFEGRHDSNLKHIEYRQVGPTIYVMYHPTRKPDGTWNLKWWAGELHSMYRVEMLGSWDHSVVYDDNLPFEKAGKLAHNACIKKWKP